MAALKPLMRLLALIATVAVMSVPARAQSEVGSRVQVDSVAFSNVRPVNGGEPWLEAVVELNVRTSSDGGAYARFADRVRVALNLALKTRDGGMAFFRSSVETISLETGRASVRFYLPPEILKREQVNTRPDTYLVDVTLEGQPPVVAASASLRTPEVQKSFMNRVAQAAPANDGVLVPQHDSPFANEYPRDTPSVRRRTR